MKKRSIAFMVFAFSASISWVLGGTIDTCAQYQAVTVGFYIVQTDYWNQPKCPGTQCMEIDDQTGSFTVTKSTPICPDVSGYPSIVYGKAWGLNSAQDALPAPLSSLQSVTSSWAFSPTYTGSWDAAYDIWICPDNQCGPSGFNGGAEVMIWMDYFNCFPGPNNLPTVDLSGKQWGVFETDMGGGNNKWKYISYSAKAPVTAVTNLAIGDFLKDSISRGYVKPDWYLYAVEAGNEMRKDGVPFTSRSFSVSVNKAQGAKTAYAESVHPPTPTPVPFDDSVPPAPGADLSGAKGQGLVIQDFSTDDPKAGGTFADSNGSFISYSLQPNGKKLGAKYLVIRFNEVPGGFCGIYYHTGNDWKGQDWTGGKAVRFQIYSKVSMVMAFAFMDKNNNQYTADAPSTKGTGWEIIEIPKASFKLDPYYTPPDAIKGAPLDLTLVKSFSLHALTAVHATIAMDGLKVVK